MMRGRITFRGEIVSDATTDHSRAAARAAGQEMTPAFPIVDLPHAPAVYAFENMEDGKLYIGSSVDAHRRAQHHLYLLRRGKHKNPYLQRAHDKHGRDKFRAFVLEVLIDCDLNELLTAEQRWISAFATTEPAHGYNIHPSPISPEYALPSAVAGARLKEAFVGTNVGRGTLTEAGRAAKERATLLTWARPGEREYRAELMREIWATPEHRAKIEETIAKRLGSPEALQAMRARLNANRMTPEQLSVAIATAWWKRNASDKFPSNEALDDWISEQYKVGASARQIGLTLGLAHGAVTRRLRERGVAMPKRGAGRRKPMLSASALAKKGINDLAEFDRQVAALYAEGNSINSIRKSYSLSDYAIRTSLHRSAVPMRTKETPSRSPTRVGHIPSLPAHFVS
jgi:GIY-YIG catalytic domain